MERKIPSALWIGIAALGAMTLIKLLVALQTGSDRVFIGFLLCVVVGAGLLLGYKWAYVVTVVFSLGNPIVMFGRNPKQAFLVLVLNSLVVVPVVLSTRFFFPGPPDHPGAEKPGTEQV